MGIFKKKICAACGEKTGLFAFRIGGDGVICSVCEMMLRGKYVMRRDGAAYTDPIRSLEPELVRDIIGAMKARQSEDVRTLGDIYHDIFSISYSFNVPTEGLVCDGVDVTALAGKSVVLGFCEYGSFAQGDRALLLGADGERPVSILRLIPCSGVYTFEEELFADAHKKFVEQNVNAWMVLDVTEPPGGINGKIVKK